MFFYLVKLIAIRAAIQRRGYIFTWIVILSGSEFLKALISEHGCFFIMFLKREKSCN